MLNYIRNMIKRAALRNNPVDTGQFQIGQISYLGSTTNAEIFHPYGFGSRPPVGSYCITMTIQGQEEHQVCFVGTPDKRVKNLNPGEVYFSNFETGTKIICKQNGNMEIDISNDYISVIKNNAKVTIDKDLNISVKGNITLNSSGSVKILSDDIELGSGGAFIARVGDQVQVDTDTGSGTIISGSTKNKSA